MSVACVFPGQGSQSVGMLKALSEQYPEVVSTFADASDALGEDLWALVCNGPSEALNQTEKTQPAMLAAGIAVYRCYRRQAAAPAFAAGHSLGEITALVAAGAIDFKAAISLVHTRGRLMQAAVPAPQGAMAAILMLADDLVIQACAESAQGQVVEAVNFNCPGQVVIAGHAEAVERAMEACKAKGAKRALRLPVSVPAHSSLLKHAAEQFREVLAPVAIAVPEFKVCALEGQWHSDGERIKEQLVAQLWQPVRWTHTITRLAQLGADRFLECGPGKVLTGLNKKIPSSQGHGCAAIEDPDSLSAAWSA